MAHIPPNDVSVRINGNAMYGGCILQLIQWIPFVISKNGRIYFVYETVSSIENNTEKSMMYPPTLVIVSNPFMMLASKISKWKVNFGDK